MSIGFFYYIYYFLMCITIEIIMPVILAKAISVLCILFVYKSSIVCIISYNSFFTRCHKIICFIH